MFTFARFADFFDTPAQNSAAPQALGFDGFFRGAYGYHWHNAWWRPFDRSRNFPDLGPRLKTNTPSPVTATRKLEPAVDTVANDMRDLDWSAVMKRTFEAFIRGETPNMYGEWIQW